MYASHKYSVIKSLDYVRSVGLGFSCIMKVSVTVQWSDMWGGTAASSVQSGLLPQLPHSERRTCIVRYWGYQATDAGTQGMQIPIKTLK
jgi:hypothetical protein